MDRNIICMTHIKNSYNINTNRYRVTRDLWLGLVLLCLTPLSAMLQLYRGGQCLLVEETRLPGENH